MNRTNNIDGSIWSYPKLDKSKMEIVLNPGSRNSAQKQSLKSQQKSKPDQKFNMKAYKFNTNIQTCTQN